MSINFKDTWEKIEERYLSGEHIRKQNALRERLVQRPVAIFGCGGYGARLYTTLCRLNIDVTCFIDNYKTGFFRKTQIPIIRPSLIQEKCAGANIMIATHVVDAQLHAQLLSLGISEKQIFGFDVSYKLLENIMEEKIEISITEMQSMLESYEAVYSLYQDENSRKIIMDRIKTYLFRDEFSEYESIEAVYFPKHFMFTDAEVFVDVGLFTGDTTEQFIQKVCGKYGHIYGFEFDPKNLAGARQNLAKYANITFSEYGLSNTPTSAKANLGLGMGSNLSENGSDEIKLTALDDYFQSLPVGTVKPTFIKMDIEGAELAALQGAKGILAENKPKLAIASYHKPEDMYEIPLFIKRLNSDYRLMLRHYSRYMWDTVLYAW
jgi:FkbM family methyltransferase